MQLDKLAKEGDKEMRRRKKQERERFLAQEVAAPYDTTVDPFVAPLGTRRARAKLTYRNPENPGQTWSGRGKQPPWVKEARKDGATLEELQGK